MSSSSLHFRSLEAEEIVGDEAVDEAAPTFNEESNADNFNLSDSGFEFVAWNNEPLVNSPTQIAFVEEIVVDDHHIPSTDQINETAEPVVTSSGDEKIVAGNDEFPATNPSDPADDEEVVVLYQGRSTTQLCKTAKRNVPSNDDIEVIVLDDEPTGTNPSVYETARLNVPFRVDNEVIVVNDEPNGTNSSEVYELHQLNVVVSNTPSATENVIYQKTYGVGFVKDLQLSHSIQRPRMYGDPPVNENSSGTAAKEVHGLPQRYVVSNRPSVAKNVTYQKTYGLGHGKAPQLSRSLQRLPVDGNVLVNENSSGTAAKGVHGLQQRYVVSNRPSVAKNANQKTYGLGHGKLSRSLQRLPVDGNVLVNKNSSGTAAKGVYEVPKLNVLSNTPIAKENLIYQKTYGLGLVEEQGTSHSFKASQLSRSIQRLPVQAIISGRSATKGEEKRGNTGKEKRREVRTSKSNDELVTDGAAKKFVVDLVNPSEVPLSANHPNTGGSPSTFVDLASESSGTFDNDAQFPDDIILQALKISGIVDETSSDSGDTLHNAVYEVPQFSLASNTPNVTENMIYQKTYDLGLVEVPQLCYSLPQLQVVGNVPVNDENSSGTAPKEAGADEVFLGLFAIADEQTISSGRSASKGERKKGKTREVRKRKSRDELVVDGAVKKLVNPADISLFSDENENVVMSSETTVTTKKAGDVSEILVCSEPSDGISSEAQAPLSVRHPNNGRSSPSVMAVASAESSSTLRKAWIL